MNKPDDIPQWAWDATNDIWHANPESGGVEITARAIMAATAAEREAAAVIAEEYDGDGLTGGYDMHLGDARLTAREIADAIRNRK